MITVRDLIQQKGSQVPAVKPDAMVLEAMKFMADTNTGAVLVMNGKKVAGLLSERDCIRKMELAGKTAQNTKVSEIMTRDVLYGEADQSLEECMAIMIDKNIRHLPVYEGGKLLGLISVRDLLKEVVDYQKFMISQLEHYITGTRH